MSEIDSIEAATKRLRQTLDRGESLKLTGRPDPANLRRDYSPRAIHPDMVINTSVDRALAIAAPDSSPAIRAALRVPPGHLNLAPSITPTERIALATSAYAVPPDAQKVKRSWWSITWRAMTIAVMSPVYLAFGLLSAIPATIGGVIEAFKSEGQHGQGTFYEGFRHVYRWLMDRPFFFIQRPVESLGARITGEWIVAPFYVDTSSDPTLKIYTIRYRLSGNPDHVQAVMNLERNIEEHLAIPGRRVNVEFVTDPRAKNVTDIKIDPKVWSNYRNWNPLSNDNKIDFADAKMIAHETMHNLGLIDEYCPCDHFDNPYMGFWQRLGAFLGSLVVPRIPKDAHKGIMMFSAKEPLPRHYKRVDTRL